MSNYTISAISKSDARAQKQVDVLLAQEGLVRDAQLEETLGVFDDAFRLVATGSISGNTLRCIAVDRSLQGEGLLAMLLTTLVERQAAKGHHHLFLYTKPETARYFTDLGFYVVADIAGSIVFMENRRDAYTRFMDELSRYRVAGRTAAVVMNANPFTLGHQYLLERAAKENDAVRCFVVSEDRSLVPFSARLALVKAGSAHLGNVTVHPTGSYIISSATFPAYFLKDSDEATRVQARLDVEIFAKVARAMGITSRYIGEEPFSQTTSQYNEIMLESLPAHGIECVLIPRVERSGEAVSASRVRQLLHDGDISAIHPFVPASTYAYFTSEEGKKTIEAIRAAKCVWHN